MIYRVLVFLVLNFAALGIGRYFMGEGPSSDWYRNLNQAPWTPPGWIFGVSWTIIMICFALYMAYAWQVAENRKLVVLLFFLQWIVNILWNPVFFKYHQVFTGLIIIFLLTLVVGATFFLYLKGLKVKSVLILPYLVWLLIACSLNAYIYFKN